MEEKFPMRINKYLALKKHSTRRGADELIKDKKVFINGKPAVLGDKVNENDKVEVRFRGKEPTYIYLAYNKPIGVMTEEITSRVSVPGVFPIGRIDKESHGLIILTNDGRITDHLLSPKYFHEKEYVVKTKEKLRNNFKEKMEKGVQIDEEKTAPCKVQIINDNTFRVVLTEGKRHQIRRMCVALFAEVVDLKRTRIMNIELGKIPDGAHRAIKGKELEIFLHSLELA
jgi:23S rRNA pseudouridine2604 synthase